MGTMTYYAALAFKRSGGGDSVGIRRGQHQDYGGS
jgi:hypothetical protein